jgi:hypothetical protein
MRTVKVKCTTCGIDVVKPVGEYNRSVRLGRDFFCSSSCAAEKGNAPRRRKEFQMVCPGCGKTFTTTTYNKDRRHCSPSCASKASMSEERRNAQRKAGFAKVGNLSSAKGLKSREKWKYSELEKVLTKELHEFEFELGDTSSI